MEKMTMQKYTNRVIALKQTRKCNGITKKEMAERAGITVRYLSDIENLNIGIFNIFLEDLEKTLDELVKEKQKE